ncbi:MAG TPA: sigma-70 family RNA polymerase sigma factor [Bacteroidales bacterium]|nr:sigma-70 family RNA polymerase sigma factor [Bacteroidales bacterium]
MALSIFGNHREKKKDLLSLTDEQLVSHYARLHDAEYVGQLYERYTHLVFAVCMKYLGNEEEAEDTVMLIFEKLLTELKHARIDSFKSWLYTVTKNQCLMQFRHQKTVEKSKLALLKDLESEVMESGSPMHLISGNNYDDHQLETAISRLNEAQRQCIILFYLEEQSYREVAETTGYSMNEVKSHLQNGRRNLKIILENNHET